ncbi:catalase [Sorangium sp. So ce233]|uniref:catalase n=1 Tax=Sorangium sp. So ce233 TaxID=3133290 RepID=UPI003F5E2A4A
MRAVPPRGRTTHHRSRDPISPTDDSLKRGPRGPTLLEDAHFREELTRLDHERIPERVMQARGSGAHGNSRVTPVGAARHRRRCRSIAADVGRFRRMSPWSRGRRRGLRDAWRPRDAGALVTPAGPARPRRRARPIRLPRTRISS